MTYVEKTGATESDSNALKALSDSLREVERRGIENERIARVIIQSTPNAHKIAAEINNLRAIPIKGDIVDGKLKWR